MLISSDKGYLDYNLYQIMEKPFEQNLFFYETGKVEAFLP